MMTSMYEEKAFDKIQRLCMMKTPSKLETENFRNFINKSTKTVCLASFFKKIIV